MGISLVRTWLEAGKAAGLKTNSAVLQKLNQDLGKRIQDNRLYEWRSGAQSIPVDVIDYMLAMSVEFTIKQWAPRAKMTKYIVARIVKSLSIPKRTK